MNATEAARFLKVQSRNIFPVPSINSIIRIGKIPRLESEGSFWTPIWKISLKYNKNQVMTILAMAKKKLHNFAIAFENEDNYLIMSDERLDESYSNMILSKIKEEEKH
jgi:hypothetical protein